LVFLNQTTGNSQKHDFKIANNMLINSYFLNITFVGQEIK